MALTGCGSDPSGTKQAELQLTPERFSGRSLRGTGARTEAEAETIRSSAWSTIKAARTEVHFLALQRLHELGLQPELGEWLRAHRRTLERKQHG